MLDLEMKYGYNDVSIVPAKISYINHRSDVNPCQDYGMLPIFAAPMSSIYVKNSTDFWINGISNIVPRSVDIKDRLSNKLQEIWRAFSLSEIEKYFIKNKQNNFIYKICIDIANGHLNHLYEVVKKLKSLYPRCEIMTGNIANPMTLHTAANAGVDYIRLGIGSGAGCITSSNTAIHYPMASLINDCYKYKKQWNLNIKLIADGGIRNYDDVIKALALGADYVMIGGLFAECKDTNPNYYIKSNGVYCKANEEDLQNLDIQLYHKFYGMASKQGMKDLHLNKHTAEGIVRYIPIKYDSLHQWTSNMEDYLRSAMSYCNVKRLQDFIGTPKVTIISNNAKNAINK